MLEVIPLHKIEPDNLRIELSTLPTIKKQRRKQSASSSLSDWQIMGADTETIEGAVWLFSTEMGVWEVESFGRLLEVLYSPKHARLWRQGARGKNAKYKSRKSMSGISTRQFFFWNLKFDVQACLRLLPDEIIETLIDGEKATVTVQHPQDGPVEVELSYLEGKHFKITPKDYYVGDVQHKVGPCEWWDISQFYHKQPLKKAALENGLIPKIERCFDGTKLDASRFDEVEYRDFYYEDILQYAIHDAVLAGQLARKRRDDFVQSGIRFIQPFSLANVAQRNLLDTCDIPPIDPYLESESLMKILNIADTAYQGGWFETTGSGYYGGEKTCTAVDLASAYPYVMYHLPDTNKGYWIQSDDTEAWDIWMREREVYSIGFAEAFVIFDEGLPVYPLVKRSQTGTLVAPRIIKGWFTADELEEAKKWPHSTFIIGEWVRFVEDNTQNRPFQAYYDRVYKMKVESEPGSVPYMIAKILANSIYGKTRQAIDGKAGKLWNPMYASTICGGTRARLAELIRLNDFTALSIATDGLIFPTESFHNLPPRPLPAPYNLGEWELEGEGELLVAMSGVYSMVKDGKVSTVFRGSAALFLREYSDGGLFRFCVDNRTLHACSMEHKRPLSAREARIKGDFTLMNRFLPRAATFSALGDSTKRLWPNEFPRTFGDLSERWWPSSPHREIDTGWITEDEI